MNESPDTLRARLNAETARVAWGEIERHFARGAVLRVSPALDLVETAARLVEDDADAVARWRDAGDIATPTAKEARQWQSGDADLWAVVVAPWVLVQADPETRPGP